MLKCSILLSILIPRSLMNKVLLSEAIHESGIRLLEREAEVIVCSEPTEKAIGSLISDVDALIIRTAGKVTREMIKQAGRLKVISRTGGGLNNVDIEAATDYNIVVCGVKGPQDRLVAEHTVALMGALAKQFFYLDAQVRKGILPRARNIVRRGCPANGSGSSDLAESAGSLPIFAPGRFRWKSGRMTLM